MPNYCVNTNAQANGDHEVHNLDSPCSFMPSVFNRLNLGWHSTCTDAVRKAKQTYPQSNGCYFCVPGCHTG